MSYPIHSPPFYHLNKFAEGLPIMQLLIMQVSRASCCFLLVSLEVSTVAELRTPFFWNMMSCNTFLTQLATFPGGYFMLPTSPTNIFNPLNPKLNPICYLLALLAHHFLHVSRIRVKSLTLRLLMSYIYIYVYIYIYIYGAPILDVSRSYTTTQHSR